MDRRAWQAIAHGGHKESDMTEVTEHTQQTLLPSQPACFEEESKYVSGKEEKPLAKSLKGTKSCQEPRTCA